MRVENGRLIVKTDERWYEHERSGRKPCTLRFCKAAEWCEIADQDPAFIHVQRGEDEGTSFTRLITYMDSMPAGFPMAMPEGFVLAVVCWAR